MNPTFKSEGYRRIKCSCGHFICEVRLDQEKTEVQRCKSCGIRAVIRSPERGRVGDEDVIFFGPNNGLWTADLTDDEIRNSVKE